MKYKKIRAIISGGGTGGHIFPALSIADKLMEMNPETEILFVGADGRMEMEKVPAAGYRIVGLPVSGLKRKLTLSNLALPFKVLKSIRMAKKLIREFQPDIAIGVGGYASAPLLWAAESMGIPTLIQEQNGFAGLTNKILGKKARCICVAYEGMERFFPADRLVLSGNPIRKEIKAADETMKAEALGFYGLDPEKKHILIVGGSLGSGTLNNAMKKWIQDGCPGGEGIEVIWQCGKYYKKSVDAFMEEAAASGMGGPTLKDIHHSDFIQRMDLAYAAADIVITRSGASSISELCVAGKAAIFVPSPNVTEDHQTHNAMALVNKEAGIIVKDSDAVEHLMKTACRLVNDPERIALMESNIMKLGRSDAARTIAEEVYRIIMPYRNIYFIGIGGIGMSAIARYYNAKGYNVSGYDKTPSPLLHELLTEGISVHFTDDISFVPKEKDDTLVVYTPAIPKDMGELVYAQENGYRVIKRSRMLGEIAAGQRCMAVAGTHGKTTTSTLLSHIFTDSGEGCSAFLGGISKNYGSNLLIHDNDVIVAEADEFDRSFLQLFPETAVITSMDADHLDIYGDEAHIVEAFRSFASQVSGTVIVKHGLDITKKDTRARILTYAFDNPKADFYAEPLENGHFNLHYPGGVIKDCVVGIPGWVNIENGVGASAIALTYGLAPDKIKAALASFSGVKRRFDVQIDTEGLVYIDDYAHHPKEIAAAISSIKERYPEYRYTAIFQPHLYTRTRDFADEFAQALSLADNVILLDIYPAREEPIPGVTSQIIFDGITSPSKVMLEKDRLPGYLEELPLGEKELFITLGAGDIDRLVISIGNLLYARKYGNTHE